MDQRDGQMKMPVVVKALVKLVVPEPEVEVNNQATSLTSLMHQKIKT